MTRLVTGSLEQDAKQRRLEKYFICTAISTIQTAQTREVLYLHSNKYHTLITVQLVLYLHSNKYHTLITVQLVLYLHSNEYHTLITVQLTDRQRMLTFTPSESPLCWSYWIDVLVFKRSFYIQVMDLRFHTPVMHGLRCWSPRQPIALLSGI